MSIYAGGGNLGTLIVLRWQQSLNGFLSAVWPDLAKTPHFGHILKAFDQLLRVWWVFDKILNLLWQNLCAIGQILIAENVPKENKSFSHLDTLLECFLVYPYSSHCTYTVHMPMMLLPVVFDGSLKASKSGLVDVIKLFLEEIWKI